MAYWFFLLYSIYLYSKAKLACCTRYLLTSYFGIPISYYEKDIFFFLVLPVKGFVDFHKTGQLLQHQQLGHRLGLL